MCVGSSVVSNFSSFIMQLNASGSRNAVSGKWAFAHEDFIIGQPLDFHIDADRNGRQTNSWELRILFRFLCEHHSQLFIAMDVLSSLPSANLLGRQFGEPARTDIIHTHAFLINAREWAALVHCINDMKICAQASD
ncbi:hypothetical protein PVL29_024297 [Vitis rotundifolia]|uniref:PRMT5 TIM barrel domain-containing protein n=1 Tax=Vitis rotundifolia TaxID=103349 RepID=A0AA39D956_VITRO|nr:hypothetical protein PVL29_024297 [Vitis rotundifolia]